MGDAELAVELEHGTVAYVLLANDEHILQHVDAAKPDELQCCAGFIPQATD
jgi:hypothetical protein